MTMLEESKIVWLPLRQSTGLALVAQPKIRRTTWSSWIRLHTRASVDETTDGRPRTFIMDDLQSLSHFSSRPDTTFRVPQFHLLRVWYCSLIIIATRGSSPLIILPRTNSIEPSPLCVLFITILRFVDTRKRNEKLE